MEFIAEQKFLLISPRKVRPVVDEIRKLKPQKALEILPFIRKRGNTHLIKVIKSAVSNALQKGVDINNLIFKEILVNEGPRLKRGIPASKGRWHPIKKRMSHIRIVLQTTKSEIINSKSETKTKNEIIKTKNKTVRKEKLK